MVSGTLSCVDVTLFGFVWGTFILRSWGGQCLPCLGIHTCHVLLVCVLVDFLGACTILNDEQQFRTSILWPLNHLTVLHMLMVIVDGIERLVLVHADTLHT